MNSHSPSIKDYTKLLKKWQKYIIVNICVITIATVVLSLIMPKTFKAVAVLMPPKSAAGNTFQSDSVNPLIPLSGLFGNFTDESMNLISIVQSRTVMEKVITKFNLIEFYKVDNIEEALEELEDDAKVKWKWANILLPSLFIVGFGFIRLRGEKNRATILEELYD